MRPSPAPHQQHPPPGGGPPIVTDDDSAFTPDIDPAALQPDPDAPVPQPDIGKLGQAVGVSGYVRSIALMGLFVLAVVYTMHLARSFLVPIVLAVLFDFLLSPVVRWLGKLRIAEPIAAGIVVFGFLFAVAFTAYQLAPPAAAWVARAPESIGTVRDKLSELRRPVQEVSRAAEQMEEATEVAESSDTPKVQIAGPSLTEQIFGGTTSLIAGALIVVFLTYFLLAAGDLFLEKLVKVLPQFKDKRKAVMIARETEAQVSSYLFTHTLVNIGVGIVTAIAMYLVGMPNPMLWGVVAGVLNFVPYVGATINIILLGLAAILTFESTARALLVPAVFFGINMLEGNLITPSVMGRKLRLNTVAVFVGLMFFWYVWGIPGAIIAVPLLASLKIVCDHVEMLAPIGEFLGR